MGDANVCNVIVFKGFMLAIGVAFGTFHLGLGFIVFEWNIFQKKTRNNKWIAFGIER